MPLVDELGTDVVADLSFGRDLGSHAPLRFWFYRWMVGIDNLLYGISERADDVRASGVAEVTARIVEPLLPGTLFAAAI